MSDNPTKPADSDQIAKARAFINKKYPDGDFAQYTDPIEDLIRDCAEFAASERQAVIEDCAKMADQIAKSCSACSYSREKHGEEPSFCESFGCSSFADLAAAIRSME